MATEIVEAATITFTISKSIFAFVCSAFVAAFGFLYKSDCDLDKRQTEHEKEAEGKISSLQAKIDDIPHMRDRIDKIYELLMGKS